MRNVGGDSVDIEFVGLLAQLNRAKCLTDLANIETPRALGFARETGGA